MAWGLASTIDYGGLLDWGEVKISARNYWRSSFEHGMVTLQAMIITRKKLIILTRRGFLLLTAAVFCAIFAFAFEQQTRGRFISQMNDAGQGGTLILVLVIAAAATAGVIAMLYGRYVAGLLRFAIAVLVSVIMTTNAYSGGHAAAYFGVLGIYIMITVFSVMTLASATDLLSAIAIPLGLAVVIVITQYLGDGPSGQKLVLMAFLVVECFNVCVCFPQRLAWFDGIDGT